MNTSKTGGFARRNKACYYRYFVCAHLSLAGKRKLVPMIAQ